MILRSPPRWVHTIYLLSDRIKNYPIYVVQQYNNPPTIDRPRVSMNNACVTFANEPIFQRTWQSNNQPTQSVALRAVLVSCMRSSSSPGRRGRCRSAFEPRCQSQVNNELGRDAIPADELKSFHYIRIEHELANDHARKLRNTYSTVLTSSLPPSSTMIEMALGNLLCLGRPLSQNLWS
ncbi:hypothetical protein BJV77DRAFT_735068 [Russula vinacea]|nr:hypothetical protein BJV77DRAFT_735068 [Russula vinacea]